MRNFREYEIWQNAFQLTVKIYPIIHLFPESERFGLANQLKRALISISSNIAEGCSRHSETDFARMLEIALGSAYEAESQLLLAQTLKFVTLDNDNTVFEEIHQLQKQISALIQKIRNKK